MTEVLNKEGYVTQTAENAEEALHVVQNRPIKLVLLDIIMPGKNGFDLIEQFKTEYPDLLIIVVTAYEQLQQFKDRKDDLPVEGFIFKPFDLNDFLASIERVLEESKLTPQ